MRLSKKRIVLVVAILAIAIWFVMSLINKSMRADVAETANQFLTSWRSGDYPTAYLLMSEAYRTQHSLTAFTNDRMMQLFVETSIPDSKTWTVDASKNVELRGRNCALVSEFYSTFLGMQCVVGACYELRRGPTGWWFTGEVVDVRD